MTEIEADRLLSGERSGRSSDIQPYAWVILLVAYLASVMAPLNQTKVPPLMPVLMDAFQITLTQAGSLMSVFGVMGFLLALPAGFILARLGPRVTGLIALGSLVAGSLLGAVAPGMALLLTSRMFEGAGMGLIAVVAPAAISMWFPQDKQGTPMGIWATWVPVGSLLMMILAPWLAGIYSWRASWWLGAGVTIATMVVYGLFMRLPPAAEAADPSVERPFSFKAALANRDIWLLALSFASFNFVFMPLATFYPTFLAEVRGYSLAQAAIVASISTGLVLVSAPLAGWFSDRIGSRKKVITTPFLIIAVMMLFPFSLYGWQIYLFLALLGLVAGAVPTATFAAASEVMGGRHLAGLGLSVVMLGQNFGIFVAPIVFGKLVESIGWSAAGYWLIPMSLLGFVFGWLVRVR